MEDTEDEPREASIIAPDESLQPPT